jgi:ABC-type transport system substrate-binding protein
MRKKTTFVLLALVISMAFTAGYLAKAEEEDPFASTIPMVYGTYYTTVGFDPLGVYDGGSGDVLSNHVEGLYANNLTDPDLGIEPRLAADMGTWNADKTEWTIPLRTDVTWQDGSEFTADDVKWNWDRLNTLCASFLCDHASLWYDNSDGSLILNNTEVIDSHTIKFTLNKPWKDFEPLQAFWGCFMIKPIDGKEDELITNDEALDIIIGTGPFVLDDFVANDKTVLVANNDYYRGAPDIQKLIFKVYAGSVALNQAFMAHECHIIPYTRFENWDAITADISLSYVLRTLPVLFYYDLNVNNIDWAVRKAMQYAYNYPYLIESVWDNVYLEAHTPVPSGMPGYNPDLEGLPYYNISVARQYLIDDPTYGPLIAAAITNTSDDEEWKDLAETAPLATHNFTHYGTGLQYQLIDNMEYIGIRVVDNVVGDWGTFLSSNLDDLEIVMGGWGPDYWHPINMIEPLFSTIGSSNWNGLANDTIDGMMGEAHALEGDALLTKIDEIVTAIIVEQAAAMYYTQRRFAVGWDTELITPTQACSMLSENGDSTQSNSD